MVAHLNVYEPACAYFAQTSRSRVCVFCTLIRASLRYVIRVASSDMPNSPYDVMSRAVARALREARPKGVTQHEVAAVALHRNRSKLSRAETGNGWQVDAAELFLLLNLYGELGLDPVMFVTKVLEAYQDEMTLAMGAAIPLPVQYEDAECLAVCPTAKPPTPIVPVAIVA